MTRTAPSLAALADAARTCEACGLYQRATQTVFGEGPPDADVVLLGEQPGDQEDRAGRPFVGPAGRVLDHALRDAGLDRDRVYVSNVVKHFKWRAAGKVRLHQKPDATEVAACRQWWEQEIQFVRPAIVVCLGATAAQAVLGPSARVGRDRGRFVARDGYEVSVTAHPSSILRAPEEARGAAFAALVADLAAVAARLPQLRRDAPGFRPHGGRA